MTSICEQRTSTSQVYANKELEPQVYANKGLEPLYTGHEPVMLPLTSIRYHFIIKVFL